MPTERFETVREFVYAGRFSPGELIAAGIALAIAVGVLTWWESRRVNAYLLPLLVALRLGAVAIVLWMLAGPTILTKVRHTKPKSIGLLVDTSASMSVIDGEDGTATAIRWAAVHRPSDRSELLVEMDGGAVALAAARGYFVRFAEACQGERQTGSAQEAGAHAQKLTQAAIRCLEQLSDRMGTDGAVASSDLSAIRSTLADDVLPRLASVADDMRAGRLLLAQDRVDRLETLRDVLDGITRRLTRLADEFAKQGESGEDQATFSRARAQSAMTRLEKVTGLLEQAQTSWLRDVEHKARLIRYRFDNSVFPVAVDDWRQALSPADEGPAMSTDLAAAMEQAARDSANESIEAVVLLTDGGHNAGGDPLKVASAMSGLPVHVVPVGNTEPLRDVMLHHVQGPRTVFQNDLIVIEATVDAHGCVGEELVVELLKDEAVVDSEEIAVSSDTFIRRFTFARKAEQMGMQEFHLRVQPVPDERIDDNNEAQLRVEVTEDTIRVLLADHTPRWEFRYLRNLFKREEHIEFDELLFEPRRPRSGQPATGAGFPGDLAGWSRYRVAILGDLSPSELTTRQQALLEEYVDKRAGTLVLIAGRDWMPGAYMGQTLGRMVPVEASNHRTADRAGFGLFVTSEGASVPVTCLSDDPLANERVWREQLPIYDVSPYSYPKPTSHVLIGAAPRALGQRPRRPNHAFLCWQNYGRGRVVYLSAPATHRLRFRQGDRYHHRFWGQLLRWAIAREIAGGSRMVRLVTDKTQYEHGDEVHVTVRLSQRDGDPVSGASCRGVARQSERVVATVDLVEDEDAPGLYAGVFKGLSKGRTTISVAGVEVQSLLAAEGYTDPVETFVVINPDISPELRNTRCNLPLLAQIAEATGGLVVPPTGLAAAVSQLDLSPEVSETVTERPLWTRWTCLWVFLGCLTVEWVVRKSVGLA